MTRKLMTTRWIATAMVATLLGAALAVAPLAHAQAATPHVQSEAEKVLLEKARSLDSRGRYDLAGQNWRQLLLSDPKNTEALAGAAKSAMEAGQSKDASIYLDQLRAIAPNDPRIAQVEAIHAEREAAPQVKEAGRLAESGQFGKAMDVYRKAYGNNPPAGDVALAYYETEAATPEGHVHAIEGLRRLAKQNPGDQRYDVALGRILTYDPKTRGEGMAILRKYPNNGEAVAALRMALSFDVGNPATEGAVAAFLKQHPDKDLEARLHETEAKYKRSTNNYAQTAEERAAYAALNANNLPLADQRFTAIKDKQPNNPRALAGLGFVRMKQNNFGGAISYLESAKANGLKGPGIDNALATSHFWFVMSEATAAQNQNQLDVALSQYRRALDMRPASPEALGGLGGALLQSQQPAEAAQVFAHLIKLQPGDAGAWRGLFTSQYLMGDSTAALATVGRFPQPVRVTLASDPEYLTNLSAAYAAVGDEGDSQRVLTQAMDLPFPDHGMGLKPDVQLHFADLLMQAARYPQAAGLYTQVITANPNDPKAYAGLVRAQHQAGMDAQALSTVESMPQPILAVSERDPGFLSTIAAIYQSQGRFDVAQKFMEQAVQQTTAGGQAPSSNMELELAGIYIGAGNNTAAFGIYQQILGSDPHRQDAWKGLISGLHAAGRDRDAIAELKQVPPEVRAHLDQDPQFLQLLASVYTGAGNDQLALVTIREAALHYQAARVQPPVGLAVQYCYLLLNAGDDRGLYLQLMQLGGRTDLTADQRTQVQIVWAIWSVRRAQQAAKGGNTHKAIEILDAANRAFPNNPSVQKALAGGYQSAGQAKRAEGVYLQMDWAGATEPDYHAAIGAALAAKDMKQALTWLEAALKNYPNVPEILQEAAEYEQAKGDIPKAAEYYKASLDAMGPEDTGHALVKDINPLPQPGEETMPQTNPSQELIQALAPGAEPEQAVPLYSNLPTQGYLPGQAPVPVQINPNGQPVTPVAGSQPMYAPPQGYGKPQQQKPQQPVQRLGDYAPPQSSLTPADECALRRMSGEGCDRQTADNSGWSIQQAIWRMPQQSAAAPATQDTEVHVAPHARLRLVMPNVPAKSRAEVAAEAAAKAPATQPNTSPVQQPVLQAAAVVSTPAPSPGSLAVAAARPQPVQFAQTAQTVQSSHAAPRMHLRIPGQPVVAAAASQPVVAAAQPVAAPVARPQPPAAVVIAVTTPARNREPAATPTVQPVSRPVVVAAAEPVQPQPVQPQPVVIASAKPVETVPGIAYAPAATSQTYREASYASSYQTSVPTYAAPVAPAAQPMQVTPPVAASTPLPAAAPVLAVQQGQPYSAGPPPSTTIVAGMPGYGTYSQPSGQPYNPSYGPGYSAIGDQISPVQQQPYYARTLPTLTGAYQQAMPHTGLQTQRDQVAEQLAALQGGYSPWVGGTGIVSYRSGTPGFDKFVVFSSPLEGSMVLSDSIRATLVLKPVLIDSGTPQASPIYRQGTLALGVVPDTQTASGIGGEIQIRSANYGISGGYTPYGFVVGNFIGSIFAKPNGGPFNFTFTRDSVTDTQLSYSGLHDTGTTNPIGFQPRWGGVVANSGEIQYATTTDHSGYYIQGGAQYITGKNVLDNYRADGDAGAYWRVAHSDQYGALTLGMNLFAMHYEHNLRYFTFGQGGYFSPDAYMLANIPVTFNGHYGRNLHYRINGSLGVQAFQEDSSLYFPTLTGYAGFTPGTAGNPLYPTRDSISGNYLIDSEIAYRVTEHWYAGAFFNANNSRDYNSVTAGFYVRYMFREQFPTEEGPPTGIFPATGMRPVQVP